jgi:protein-S-isoprenylcysteine O-methyltransferase Ste14
MNKSKSPAPSPGRASNWLDRLDRWILFEPARWPYRECISRLAAVCIIAVFLGLRIYRFELFPQYYPDAMKFYGTIKTAAGQTLYSPGRIALLWWTKLAVWIVETAIYVGYIAAYASRAKAVGIARGFLETWFPVIVAGIPVLMSMMPYSLPRWAPFNSMRHLYFFIGISALILLGGSINFIGLLTLRRAFTIMSEARELITHGIFRYVRHPLYTGHFIMFLGSLLLRLHPITVGMYVLFFIGQTIRAKIEERKLKAAFSAYDTYQRRTGMFLPRL